MAGIELISYATQALFLCVALYVAWKTYWRPTKSNINILIFFSLMVVVIAYTWVQAIIESAPGFVPDSLTPMLLMTLPYVLLRLARDFSSVPRPVMRLSEIGLVTAYVLTNVPGLGSFLVLFLLVSYFAAVSIYAGYRFHAGMSDANGITQKRLRALSYASALLGLALFSVIFTSEIEGVLSDVILLMRQSALAVAAVLYLIGFAPPAFVRRSWQEPELREFLHETLRVPRWSSTDDAMRQLEAAAAGTVGAPNAVIGLWNPETERIDFRIHSFMPGETIGGRAFLNQRPLISLDTVSDDPDSREIYERGQAFAVMAAPISTSNEKIGVIALYSPNPPIFAEDDLSLLSLIADQISVLLENRQHLQAQAELAAREESTRLKDEFLSVAAHDLKTPLTTIIGTGQYLERRLAADGKDSTEYRLAKRLNRESKRLQTLVQGLLDASRIERGQLITNLETTDLSGVIDEVLERSDAHTTHFIEAEIAESLVGEFDPIRLQQVTENLIENARKYSPEGSVIRVKAWAEGNDVRLSVSDQGIGIGPDELDKVFDRFYRSTTLENGATSGIGLGLYICKQIVEQHGGRIWVESTLGRGTTFHVSLSRTGLVTVENDTVDSRSG